MPVAAPVCQPQVRKVKTRRKPHIAVRVVLQVLSFILCIALAGSVMVTVVLGDMNHLMSAGGIKQLINGLLMPYSAPQRVSPVVGAAGAAWDSYGGFGADDIPDDLFGGSSEESTENLVKWLYEKMQETSDKPLKFSEETLMEFVQESSISDYLAEKMADYTQDFINDTEKATISVDEIMDLLEENEELLEETFDVKLDSKLRNEIQTNVEKAIEENDMDTMIREQVFGAVEKAIDESLGGGNISWKNDIQPVVKLLCADTTLYTAIGICLVLLLLLCLLNFYNVPAGLTWAAVPTILVGLLMTLPLWAIAIDPAALSEVLPKAALTVLTSFVSALLPVHSVALYVGFGLLVISIFWRVIRSSVNNARMTAPM